MFYREPNCLAVVWFGSSPTPFPSPPLPAASSFLSLPVCGRSSLLTGEGGSKWSRSQIIRHRLIEEAWPSIIIQYSLSSLLTGEGGMGGRGAKSYDREDAWPSINYSIFSGKIERQPKSMVFFTDLVLWFPYCTGQCRKNPGATCVA
jgi:hypothetical protein